MESEESNGEIYNVGNDDEEIKITDLADTLFEIVDIDVDVEILSAPKGSVARRCPDITKLKLLGYEKQTSLEEGLKYTFDWYKNHYKWYSKVYERSLA